jgi:hypothetical protein
VIITIDPTPIVLSPESRSSPARRYRSCSDIFPLLLTSAGADIST